MLIQIGSEYHTASHVVGLRQEVFLGPYDADDPRREDITMTAISLVDGRTIWDNRTPVEIMGVLKGVSR